MYGELSNIEITISKKGPNGITDAIGKITGEEPWRVDNHPDQNTGGYYIKMSQESAQKFLQTINQPPKQSTPQSAPRTKMR
jgi:hypothetical protein